MNQELEASNYDDAVLGILAYEFSSDDTREAEVKIRRKLRAKKLGRYDRRRIDILRRLKDEVRAEVGKGPASKYYTRPRGEFADIRDFDRDRMARELAAAFPEVPRQSIIQFIEYAIYLYYLR